MRRALIVGGDGLIGAALTSELRRAGVHVLRTTRRPDVDGLRLDLTRDPATVVLPEAVDVAFLCAAQSRLQDCAVDPVGTQLVNVDHTVQLAARLVAAGAFVVFVSTTQVFDGSQPGRHPLDVTCPVTEYGRQKAAAEAALLGLLGERVAILRLTKVIGPGMPLLWGWAQALRRGEPVHPFADAFMAPVPLSCSVQALQLLANRRAAGLWHLSATRDIPYAAAARYLGKRVGARPELVQPVPAAASGVVPPRHTTLDASGLCALGVTIPGIWSAIAGAVP